MKKQPPSAEIEELMQAYVENSLEAGRAGTLLDAVKRDPSLAQVLIEHLESDAAIREAVSQTDWVSVTQVTPSGIIRARDLFRPSHRRLAVALAACIGFLAVSTSLFLGKDFQPVLAGGFTEPVGVDRNGTELRVSRGFRLERGDKILNNAESITLDYAPEKTRIELTPGTIVTLRGSFRGKRFDLDRGELYAKVAPQPLAKPMILHTTHAQARVLGTEFVLQATSAQTRLDVLEGKVRFTRTSNHQRVDVEGGYYAETSRPGALVHKPITGKIVREVWLGLSGDTLQSLIFDERFPTTPDRTDYPPSFESHTNWTSAFGTRLRGYVTPPRTGDYLFSVSGNGQIRLFLSPDDDPANKAIVAQIIFSPNRVEGDTSHVASSDKSEPITLEAGQRYYMEVLHKFGTGTDDLIVTWQGPDGEAEAIPAKALNMFSKSGGK